MWQIDSSTCERVLAALGCDFAKAAAKVLLQLEVLHCHNALSRATLSLRMMSQTCDGQC